MKEIPIWKEMSPGFRSLIKWVPITILTGSLLGLVGSAFHHVIDLATRLRGQHPWFIWFLPATGSLIPLLYKKLGLEKDPGTNIVIRSVYTDDNIPFRLAPAIFLGAMLSHLSGASCGREGAALQLGGSIASSLGKLLHLSKKDLVIITMCGMSATFSALFGTPLTAALFPIEVVSVGVVHPSALLPCLLSSLTGFAVAGLCHIKPTAFSLSLVPELSLLTLLQTMVLGILCAAVAILFCTTMHSAASLYQKYLPHPLLRGTVGGALVLALTLLVGNQNYNGAGMFMVETAIAGSIFTGAFLLKLLFTALSLGAGFKGGEIVPVFFVGAAFGCVAAPLIGLPASFGAAAGLIAVFCGVVNCPMASFLLALELFGGQGMILFAVTVTTSHLMSGYIGLYHDQRMPYSKYLPEFINQTAK